MKEVDQQSHIEVKYKTKASNYLLPQNPDEPAQITLEDGTVLSTDLIVSKRFSLIFFFLKIVTLRDDLKVMLGLKNILVRWMWY